MAKKFLITIDDMYENDIKELDKLSIDDEGIVWYNFCYDNGRLGETEPVGVLHLIDDVSWKEGNPPKDGIYLLSYTIIDTNNELHHYCNKLLFENGEWKYQTALPERFIPIAYCSDDVYFYSETKWIVSKDEEVEE